MDKDSRYVLAFDHGYAKQGGDVTSMYADAGNTAGMSPRTMITYCLDIFPKAVGARHLPGRIPGDSDQDQDGTFR